MHGSQPGRTRNGESVTNDSANGADGASSARHPARLFDWIDVVSRMRLDGFGVAEKTIKLIAFRFAIFGDPDGSRVMPGCARLSVVCGVDYRTVVRVMSILDSIGLYAKVSSGSGRRGVRAHHASVYQLTIPEDLLDRFDVMSPAQLEKEIEKVRESRRRKPNTCTESTRKELSGGGDHANGESVTCESATRKDAPDKASSDRITCDPSPASNVLRVDSEQQYVCIPTAVPTSDLLPTTTYPPDQDLEAAVTVPRARDREQAGNFPMERTPTTCGRRICHNGYLHLGINRVRCNICPAADPESQP
jgi:hypothetical protein